MRRWSSQRGEGRIGCLLWILVLLAGGLVASKVIPVKIASAQLQDRIEEIAERHPRWKKERIHGNLHRRAKELELPIRKKDIKVKKSKSQLKVDISFVVPLDLFFTTYDWNVEINVDREIFLI